MLAASLPCMISPPGPDFCRVPLPHPQVLQPQTLSSPLRANATLAMQASITISFDYSDDDDVDLAAVPPPDPKWLRITVEGERTITHVSQPSISIFPTPVHGPGPQIFLPTIPLESLTDARWDGWIATIQGPIMGRCDVSAAQRQLFLDIDSSIAHSPPEPPPCPTFGTPTSFAPSLTLRARTRTRRSTARSSTSPALSVSCSPA